MILRRLFPALLAFLTAACIEKPDPASQAAAILHKHPSSFLDKLTALDALASRELGLETRPVFAESLHYLALRLRPALEAAPTDSAKADALNAFIFDTMAIIPMPEDTSLASSLPTRVLLDRKGSCVGLVLLYLALGQSLDLPLKPVFLPGHLALRWGEGPGARNIETLRRGLARTDSFYRETFALGKRPWYGLQGAAPEQALGALVFNMGNFHRARGNWAAALEEYRLAEEMLPGYPEALGNRGAGFLVAGDRAAAREKLESSLAGDSLAAPAWRNLESIYRADGDSSKAQWARRNLDLVTAR